MSAEITYRLLGEHREFRACVELQKETWGRGFGEVVPPGLLKVVQKTGGICAGAFDADDRMLGFVFGLAGHRDGRPMQWSHMLAVAREARGLGIGTGLKLFQRDEALRRGIGRIQWSFDPLQAKNAHLNLNRLGVRIAEYVPDMYGSDTGSDLHPGEATDRLIADWHLDEERVRRAMRGGLPCTTAVDAREAPIVGPSENGRPEGSAVRIRIPCDFLELSRRDPESAREWRFGARRIFLWYLGRGYEVDAFYRIATEAGEEPCCFYYLVGGDR